MRIFYSFLLALVFCCPSLAIAKRVTLPSMFLDVPDTSVVNILDASKNTNIIEGILVKPSADATSSAIFALVSTEQLKNSYHAEIAKIKTEYIIKGSMTFAGHNVPSIFWSDKPDAAHYLLEVPSKTSRNIYIMYLSMPKGTQAQWDTWATTAETILRSLHRMK